MNMIKINKQQGNDNEYRTMPVAMSTTVITTLVVITKWDYDKYYDSD